MLFRWLQVALGDHAGCSEQPTQACKAQAPTPFTSSMNNQSDLRCLTLDQNPTNPENRPGWYYPPYSRATRPVVTLVILQRVHPGPRVAIALYFEGRVCGARPPQASTKRFTNPLGLFSEFQCSRASLLEPFWSHVYC
jgi:hypothetical protein